MSLQFLHSHNATENHTDAIWATKWTERDTVVSISADGSIVQWDSQSGQQINSLPPHTLGLISLSVSQAGDKALFNSIEGLTRLWDLTGGAVLGTHESFVRASGAAEQSEPVWAVSLHPNGSTYASTGSDGNVTIRSAVSVNFGSPIQQLSPGKTKFGMSLSYSPDGSKIALSSETGQIYLFDIEASQLLNTYTSHAMCVRSLAWSLDNQLLVSASDDKRLIMHDVRNAGKGGGAVASFNGHSSWVLNAAVSPDSKLIASGSSDRTIKVWDLAARAAVSTIQEPSEVWSVSWRPKVSLGGPGAFVSGGEDGIVKWWRGAGMG
ncbi:WD repeat-containing protein 61 [Hysterangium stoloniferum]|nr:WD repeat-containing protein 61 [Hysterangium stoloniferum]